MATRTGLKSPYSYISFSAFAESVAGQSSRHRPYTTTKFDIGTFSTRLEKFVAPLGFAKISNRATRIGLT